MARARSCKKCAAARKEFSQSISAATQGQIGQAAKHAVSGTGQAASAMTLKAGKIVANFKNAKRR